MRKSVISAVAAIVLASGSANAQDAAALAQAKMLFNAGAQAYERGQYAVAIQAFEAANKIVAVPRNASDKPNEPVTMEVSVQY